MVFSVAPKFMCKNEFCRKNKTLKYRVTLEWAKMCYSKCVHLRPLEYFMWTFGSVGD
jgi:hypothetical protein